MKQEVSGARPQKGNPFVSFMGDINRAVFKLVDFS